VKMDSEGNMMVKRLAKSNVYTRYANGENAVGSDILKLPQAALEANKGLTLFDLKKFQQNVNRELKRQYPDRQRLENQCMTSLAFVRNDDDLLNCPCWVLIINIVALDMLKGKLMPGRLAPAPLPAQVSAPVARSHIPIPDEDPYSVAGSGGSSGSSGRLGRSERPPKLPPRDTDRLHRDVPNPDYTEDTDDQEQPSTNGGGGGLRARLHLGRSKNKKERKKGDELYYGGFQARIPNFAKSKGGTKEDAGRLPVDPRDMRGLMPPGHTLQHPGMQHPAMQHPAMWQQHRGSYDAGGMGMVTLPNMGRRCSQNPMTFIQPMPVEFAVDKEWESYYSAQKGRPVQ